MAKEFVETTLLDGFADGPHITVEQVGSANQGLYGPGDYVMDAGRNAEAQILTNNSIRVFDAVFVIQGRRDVIAANDYEDINIDNGAQGMNRNDIIVRRYTKDESSEIERTEYAVIKGTPTPSTATDPEVTVGNVRNGDTLHEMKLYRVKLEGLNIVAIEPLFQVLMNMNKINKYLSDKENPVIMEKIVKTPGITLNAFEGKALSSSAITPPTVEGYRCIGLASGWGEGQIGLVVSPNGWAANCTNVKKTYNAVVLKFLYLKSF